MTSLRSKVKRESESNVPELQDLQALQAVSTGLKRFAAELYKTISNNPDENIVCSPLSASTGLSMAAHGAAGVTEVEMRTVLHLPNDRAIGLQGIQLLLDTLNSLNNVKFVEVSVANKIFSASKLKQNFKDITAKFFKSDAQYLDFGNTKEASKTINMWCAEKTRNLIKDIVAPDDLIEIDMFLVNAVYFKGSWKKPFIKRWTRDREFYIDENIVNHVPMMHKSDHFNYGTLDEVDAVFVELPYQREKEQDATSMFIILPNQINGLKKIQDNFEKIDLKQLHTQKKMTYISLSLPKFKIESFIDLKPILKKMGMKKMFDSDADFSLISDEIRDDYVCVFQKAIIEVNEEGTEAAAIFGQLRGGGYPPEELSINKPFIYAIYHEFTDSILFQGHIKRLPA